MSYQIIHDMNMQVDQGNHMSYNTLQQYLTNTKGVGTKIHVKEDVVCDNVLTNRSLCETFAEEKGYPYTEKYSEDDTKGCYVEQIDDEMQMFFNGNTNDVKKSEQTPVCVSKMSNICPVYNNYCQRYNFIIDPVFYSDKKCGKDNMGGDKCIEECCATQENHCRVSQIFKEQKNYAKCMDERGCLNNLTCDKKMKGIHELYGEIEMEYNFGIDVAMFGGDAESPICGSAYMGGPGECQMTCCTDQHNHCHLAADSKNSYFKCMRTRGCSDSYLACREDGDNPGYWSGSNKKLNYDVPAKVDDKACGSHFQGGNTCKPECCEKQHNFCKGDGEVRGYVQCMIDRGCTAEADFKLHGKKSDGTEGDECNYMNKNFGIECWFDESCESDQLCDTHLQGGAQCERDCCNKQHDYCWNGNDEMWGYFKCMRVRGCGDVMTCNENSYKEGYYSQRSKIIKYGVPHMDKAKLCGSEYQGGSMCRENCCERQHTYCKDNDGEVRGYFQCMIDRGCTVEANLKLHGKTADGTEGNECNYMGKNFGIECMFDESCESDQLCDTQLQGGAQCERDCCNKQHDYCWNGNNEMWGYFKCMRVRGCGDVMTCKTDGSKSGYYSEREKQINYGVPHLDKTKLCGSDYQGGSMCEEECCDGQHKYCKDNDGEVRGYFQCMIDRGCKAQANFKLHGKNADGTEANECNYMGKNFGIECMFDDSCESDQLCDTEMQGGSQCERDCCNKQHDYCWNGNLEMWGYFKCMRVRGCGDVLACSTNGYKKDYYSASSKIINYAVPEGVVDKKCGTEFQGGEDCREDCCIKQNEFCLDNESEIRGFLRCMENRGCYNVGLTTLSGSLPHNRHSCDTHDMNFGVPCWGDESCEEPCGTRYQGNFACGVACCEKQHEYCHKNAFEKWNYFKCMTVRGCGNKYLACSENGKKDLNWTDNDGKHYTINYPASTKKMNYGVPCFGNKCEKKCGSSDQGGEECKEECCKKQAEFCDCGTNSQGCLEHRGCTIPDGQTTGFGFSLKNETTKEYHVWPLKCKKIGESCDSGVDCADHDLVTGVGTQCCEGKCRQKKKDWIGAYYCPHEVVCFDDCCDNSECDDGEVCAGGKCTTPKDNGDPHYTVEVGCHSGADDPAAGKCKSLKSCGGYCRECYDDGHCSGTDGCRDFKCQERESRDVVVWCPCGKSGSCCCNCCWPWEGECACGVDDDNCDFTEYYFPIFS